MATHDNGNSYVYTPLVDPNSQIRLLTIPLDVKRFLEFPTRQILKCKLAAYDLPLEALSKTRRLFRASRLPLFYALSYVWGDSARSHEILVNGKTLRVTKNLYLALRAMQSGVDGAMHVWADAVCINQDDDAEKSAQIQLMREIYFCAADVRIWLGNATPETQRCLRFVIELTHAPYSVYDDVEEVRQGEDELSNATASILAPPLTAVTTFVRGGKRFGQAFIDFADIIDDRTSDSSEEAREENKYSLNQYYIPELAKWAPSKQYLKVAEDSEPDLAELANLFDIVFIQQLWFSRMWVVQELCCARSSEIQIGRTIVKWEYFLKAICYLHFQRGAYMNNIQRILGIEIIHRGFVNGKRQMLKDLIRETRYRESTDPKDKIYSLYGLMSDPMNDYLQPNYVLLTTEVYANTTRHFIIQSKSVDCLLGWQRSPHSNQVGVAGLPSWVPDYNLPQVDIPTPFVSSDRRESIFAASGHDYRAEHQPPPPNINHPLLASLPASITPGIGVLSAWQKLRVRGINIDTIASLSPFPPAANSSSGRASNMELIGQSWLSTIQKSLYLQQKLNPETTTLLSHISKIANFYFSIFNASQKPNHPSSSSPSLGPPALPPRPQTTAQLLASIPIVLDHLASADDTSLPLTYLQSLLSGRISPRERTTKEILRQVIAAPRFQQSPDARAVTTKIQAAQKILRQLLTSSTNLQQSLDETQFLAKAAQAFSSSMLYRRLAITQKGYLAVVPDSAEVGDEADVLFGASVVCVLRKADGQEEYSLVGEAYMHGFMDAEAIALCVKGELQESEFVLR